MSALDVDSHRLASGLHHVVHNLQLRGDDLVQLCDLLLHEAGGLRELKNGGAASTTLLHSSFRGR